jgi:hypothetical protein
MWQMVRQMPNKMVSDAIKILEVHLTSGAGFFE